MSKTDNKSKDIVREYLKAFNNSDYDAMAELLADDVVEHGAHEELQGVDEIVDFLKRYTEIFPDYSGSSQEIIAEDNIVTVRFSASGTHTGEYKDLEPTGHDCEWTGIAMYQVEDGEIAEIWLEEDRLEILETIEDADPEHAHLRV